MPDRIYHPMDLEESNLEKMVKEAVKRRGLFISQDEPYLEQYLHPDRDILAKQRLRPSINPSGQRDTIDYRKPAITSTFMNRPSDFDMPQLSADIDAGKKVDFSKYPETQYNTRNLAGLGHSKLDESNPKYDSVYDIWDFDTKSPVARSNQNQNRIMPSIEDWISKNVMQRIGRPYTVYDRFPKGTAYNEIGLPGDIELPPEHKSGVNSTGNVRRALEGDQAGRLRQMYLNGGQ